MKPSLDPQAGDVVKHVNGGTYSVITRALDEGDGEDLVVYRSHATGETFVRPLRTWVSPSNGRPRFVEKEPAAAPKKAAKSRAAKKTSLKALVRS